MLKILLIAYQLIAADCTTPDAIKQEIFNDAKEAHLSLTYTELGVDATHIIIDDLDPYIVEDLEETDEVQFFHLNTPSPYGNTMAITSYMGCVTGKGVIDQAPYDKFLEAVKEGKRADGGT